MNKAEIPQYIKDAIRDYADCRDRKDAVISDAIYGFSLASESIEEKDKQIEELKNEFRIERENFIKKLTEIKSLIPGTK